MKLKFPHPGWLLREEFLEPMKLSPYRLEKEIGVPLTRIMAILHGKRFVTADTGLRLDCYFGLSDGYWSGLQHDYDLRAARRELGAALKQIRPRAVEAMNLS
jgi:antitoxin HigA-1